MRPVPSEAAENRPPSLREGQKLLTRRLLLEAAQKVFVQRGYGATTVDDIVKAAGASRATFYLHFANKAEVMAAIFQSLMPATAEYWRNLDRSLGSRQDLRGWLEQAIGWWEEHREILPALHEASAADSKLAAQQYQGVRKLTGELTGYFSRAGGAKKREARLRIELLISQLDDFCMKWIVQKAREADREMVLEVLTEIWGATIGVPERPAAGGRR
jgi:AcrR family transcriptional regulator